MGKEYSKQHVVPKRYLDRFATLVDGKHLIGTRYHDGKNVRLFLESTIDVGYEKNCYDVTDKEDPKFWEHFFNREIQTKTITDLADGSAFSAILLSPFRIFDGTFHEYSIYVYTTFVYYKTPEAVCHEGSCVITSQVII